MTTHDQGTLEAAETPVTLPTDLDPSTDLDGYACARTPDASVGHLSGD